ncbi:mas-related G-protein coupled receptor member D-like [Ornithorhynchus anatinus]|uniref:mas-related G-protein coupled receptor member D-like n=1 Tax=Ornithorhynchus anatinus TaxID=9258 RepID=UPI0010A8A78F|nr:mas-related G-protein coupled receptor member D-like [Ornithorhynchus anatinus]
MARPPAQPSWEPGPGNRTDLAALIIDECPWCEYDLRTFRIIIKLVTLLICLAGLAGNLKVLWYLGLCIQRTPFSVYVLNLAVADFGFLLCQGVFTGLTFGQPVSGFHLFDNRFVDQSSFLPYTVGLGALSGLSTERSLSLLFPVWYRLRRPPHLSATICALFWALTFLWHLLRDYVCYDFYETRPYKPCFGFSLTWGALLFLLSALMLLSSLVLLVKVLCGARRPAKLYIVILILVPVFLTCGLPLGIKWFLLVWQREPATLFYYVTDVLACGNSSVRPLVYYLVGRVWRQRLRESFRVILQRALRSEEELGPTGGTSTPATVEMPANGVQLANPGEMETLPSNAAVGQPLPSAQ